MCQESKWQEAPCKAYHCVLYRGRYILIFTDKAQSFWVLGSSWPLNMDIFGIFCVFSSSSLSFYHLLPSPLMYGIQLSSCRNPTLSPIVHPKPFKSCVICTPSGLCPGSRAVARLIGALGELSGMRPPTPACDFCGFCRVFSRFWAGLGPLPPFRRPLGAPSRMAL